MSESAGAIPDRATGRTVTLRRVAAASLAGTTVEYYDFAVFSAAAALVFPHLFFPGDTPAAGTLASFATFAVGFVARPLGGIVIGHFGDRIGRKSMLIFTLVLMGIATVGIGALPGYSTIGLAAPIALVVLRILQGFAFGGEWGGAVLLAFEYAPERRRGLFGAIPQMGPAMGSLIGSMAFVVTALMPRDHLLSWGWRLPFLAGGLLVIIGLIIRLKIAESPEFVRVKTSGRALRVPVVEVLRTHLWPVLLVIGLNIGVGFGAFTYTTYLLSWASREHGVSNSMVLTAIAVGNLIQFAGIPLSGLLSDRFGRTRVFLVGAFVLGATGFAAPALLATGSAGGVLLTYAVPYGIGYAVMLGVVPPLVAESFGTRIRYSGMSLGFQLAQAIAGFAPTILAVVFASTATIYSVPLIVAAFVIVSGACAWGLARLNAAQRTVPAHAEVTAPNV